MLKYAVVLERGAWQEPSKGNYVAIMHPTSNKVTGFVFNRTLDGATLWDTAEEAVAAIRSRNQSQGGNDLYLLAPVEVTEPVPPRQRVVT